MDDGNTVAEEAVGAAMSYLEKNNKAKVAKKSMMKVEGSEAYVTVEKGPNICFLFLTNNLLFL